MFSLGSLPSSTLGFLNLPAGNRQSSWPHVGARHCFCVLFWVFPLPPKGAVLTCTCLSVLSWVLEGDPLTSESSVCAAFSSPGSSSPWALHSISTGILSALPGLLFSWRGFGSTLQAITWGNPCPLVCSPVHCGSPSFATCCSVSGKQLFHIFGLLFYIFCLVPATSCWLSIDLSDYSLSWKT